MTTLRVVIEGEDKVQRLIDRSNIRTHPQAVGELLDRLGVMTQSEAQQNGLIRGGVPGVVHPTKLTSRTGTGRRSIRVDRKELPRAVEVGSDLIYMRVHELTARHLRPWLRPSADKVLQGAEELGARIWEKHIGE